MALALAESLIERGALDPRDLMSRFVNWWRWGAYSATGECFDIGITKRVALDRFARGGDPIAGSTDPRKAGNGSLMRLSPIAIWGVSAGVDAMRSAARLQNETTHAAPQCLDACDGYTIAAITGQLAGALYGVGGIPAQWRAKLAWGPRIAGMAKALLDRFAAQSG